MIFNQEKENGNNLRPDRKSPRHSPRLAFARVKHVPQYLNINLRNFCLCIGFFCRFELGFLHHLANSGFFVFFRLQWRMLIFSLFRSFCCTWFWLPIASFKIWLAQKESRRKNDYVSTSGISEKLITDYIVNLTCDRKMSHINVSLYVD